MGIRMRMRVAAFTTCSVVSLNSGRSFLGSVESVRRRGWIVSGGRRRNVRRTEVRKVRVIRGAVTTPSETGGTSSDGVTGGNGLRLRRYGVFAAMASSYALYVGLRSTFPFAAPMMGLGLQEVGVVSSAFPFAYGFSRLATGAMVDNGSPRDVLLGGLALAGLAVAAMAATPVAAAPLAVLWAIHGLVQGAGAGCSAKLLTAWYAPSERGRWWALWATSANIGAFGAPLAVAGIATAFGPRAALAASGAIALCIAALASTVLRDTPAAAGFEVSWAVGQKAPKETTQLGFWRTLRDEVVRNKALWALAAANASIYLIRSGLKNWLHFFLIATRGSTPAAAAVQASISELGGVMGTFGAGVISDLVGGRRVIVTIAYLVLLSISLALLCVAPGGGLMDAALVATVGFAVNGPQMMIGLIGAEVVEPRVLATAAGLLGFLSYGGATMAGYPLSAIVQRYGWGAFFGVLSTAALLGGAVLTPFWRLRAGAAAGADGGSNTSTTNTTASISISIDAGRDTENAGNEDKKEK